MQRITDAIPFKDIATFTPDKPVTVLAQTGRGKSYWIKNDLYRYAKENRRKILYLVHRLILRDQFSEEIKRNDKEDIIDMRTYQSLSNNLGELDLSRYDYIIADEFHSLLTDSTFNFKTDIVLKNILAQTSSVKIFMSATGGKMKKYLKEKGFETHDYSLPFDYKYIKDIEFYHRDSALKEKCREFIRTEKKAIFFIKSLEKARGLYDKFKDYSGFVCSTSALQYLYGSDEFKAQIDSTRQYIEQNERFEQQFLFATAVMDAGVNINDPNLHEVVVDMSDLDTLTQCLGRKRMTSGEDYVNLTVKSISKRSLNGRIQKLNEKISVAEEFIRCDYRGRQDLYIKQNIRKHNDMIYPRIVDRTTNTLELNELMHFYNKELKAEYGAMMARGSWGYCETVKERLRQDRYSVYEDACRNMKITEYCAVMCDQQMDDLEKDKFIDMLDYRFNGRQIRAISKINREFEVHDIPYLIESKRVQENGERKFYWFIREAEDENESEAEIA